MPESPPPRSRAPHWVWLVPAVCAALLYLITLDHGFPWDDELIVRDAKFLRSPANVAALVTNRYFESGEISWRPVATLTHLVEMTLLGSPPVPPSGWREAVLKAPVPWATGLRDPPAGLFHAVNVGLHAAVAALVGLVALAALGHGAHGLAGAPAAIGACVAGVAAAVHPVMTEAVCVISFREDLLAGVGMLGAILQLGPWRSGTRRDVVWGTLAAAVAIGSKESALLLPLLLLGLAALAGPWPGWRALAARHGPVWIVAVVYAVLRFGPLAGPQEASYAAFAPTLPYRIPLAPALLASHVRLLCFPAPLHADHFVAPVLAWSDARPWLGLLCGGAGLAAAWHAWRTGRVASLLGVGLVAATLLPVLGLMPIPNPLAERYLYVAAAGVALVVGEAVARSAARPLGPGPALAVAGSILAAAAALVLYRLPVWRDTETLWARTARQGGHSLRVLGHQLGQAEKARDWDRQITLSREAIAWYAPYPEAASPHRFHPLVGLGQGLRKKAFDLAGRGADVSALLAEADAVLRDAHRLAPHHPQAPDDLGVLLMRQRQDAAGARPWLEMAVALCRPNNAMYRAHLAECCELLGDRAAAEAQYRIALTLDPGSSHLLRGLAALLIFGTEPATSARTAAGEAAAACWREASAANPWDADSRYNLGVFHLLRGEPQRAVEPLRQAHVLEPDQPDRARTFADAAEAVGDVAALRLALEQWARIAPGDAQPHERLRRLRGR